jgi:hypothetical protein
MSSLRMKIVPREAREGSSLGQIPQADHHRSSISTLIVSIIPILVRVTILVAIPSTPPVTKFILIPNSSVQVVKQLELPRLLSR